jgi:signal transduction histidine kinase/FixJ family two-component response regulator
MRNSGHDVGVSLQGVPDPSAHSLFAPLGEDGSLLVSTDWSATPLGPVSGWPGELVSAARTVLASRLPMLIWWGPELVQIYNKAFEPLLGDKHPAAMGQPAMLCWPEAWAELEPLVESVLAGRGGTLAQDFLLFLRRHGYLEETYWTFSYSPIVNDSHEVLGIFVATNDVTAQVVGERRLTTVHELGTLSRADLPSLKGAAQAALDVMAGNRQALPFAACYLRDGNGLRLASSYGIASDTAACPITIPRSSSMPIARVARTGQSQMFNLAPLAQAGDVAPGPLGPAVPTLAMLRPLSISGQREPVGVLALGINPYRAVDAVYRSFLDLVTRWCSTLLSDARAYEYERARTEMLTDLDEAKTRFFQNVSHEFRTPLTLVLGALQGADTESPSGAQGLDADTIETARRAALRLDRLVDAIFTFAQAEGGSLVAHRQPTDISALTQDCASMFRSAVEQAGLTLTVEVPPTATVVDMDPEMWSRIVLNLISNAYKFTPKGSIDVRVRVIGDRAVLEVRDSGIGIEADSLDRLFERFHQVPGALARTAAGAGIGLALVADLVSAHDGEVAVDSMPGQGSAFTVTVPLSSTSAAEVGPATVSERLRDQALTDLASPADRSEDVVRQDAGTGTLHGGHVLLVEDNADLCRYIARLLRENGWKVTETPDAETALDVEPAPDLVLSDVMLPGMDGLALVRALRADPGLHHTPVLLLTARAGAEAAVMGLGAGADDYIVKPFDPTELLARIAVHHELACLRNFALDEAENRSANLERALSSNRQIGAAIGVLMASHKLPSDRAFALLREASNKTNRRLRDVADQVVLTGSLDIGSLDTGRTG